MKEALRKVIYSPYFILLLIVVAANWQLVFLQSGMEWDMMNFWMPWRYYMSECYNNGIIPLWNPYTQSGYPVHGDLQGPAYSPEAILVSFLFGQNIYILNYCFVFYLFVAALAMYKLTYFFVQKKEVSILAGAIYSLSGFNVAHGHYFYIIVSVALVPFIFYYFFKILKGATYIDALKFSLMLFWHITTGNPSFLIVSGYLMVLVFVVYLAWKIKSKQARELLPVVRNFSIVAILGVLMALPVIYNAAQIIPLTTRKDGLDLAYAGDESFYFQNFTAFLIPLITITHVDLTGFEQELWSPYIGAFTLVFFVLSLLARKTFWEWCLLIMGLCGLLVAIGLQWPVYPFLHKHLPFFNIFRMPNLSLLFFLITVIIMAAKYLSAEGRAEKLFVKGRIWIIGITILAGIVLMLYIAVSNKQGETVGLFDNYKNLRQWIYEAKPAHIVSLHVIIFAATMVVLLMARLVIKNKLKAILLAVLFDVFINYQLGGTARIFSVEKADEMNEYFSRFPRGFSVPEKMAMERVSAVHTEWPGYWLNTSVFLKQPDYPNSNNFELTNYLDLLLNKPRLSKNVFKNSYFFLADSLVNEEEFTDSTFVSRKSVVSLSPTDLKNIPVHNFKNENYLAECPLFGPNRLSFIIKNEKPAFFVINQNDCPLWNYTLNGKKYEPFKVLQGSFPAFALPPGEWEIVGMYDLPGYGAILLFSLTLFAMILLLVIYRTIPASRIKSLGLAIVPLLFLFCLFKFNRGGTVKTRMELMEDFSRSLAGKEKAMVINNSTIPVDSSYRVNLICNEDVMLLDALLDSLKPPQLALLQYDRYFSREADELLQSMYGKKTGIQNLMAGAKTIFYERENRKAITDTLIRGSSVVGVKNPYSPGILLDSVATQRYQPGDLFVLSARISAHAFDFPGVSLELHYADGTVTYKYANVSTIKKAGSFTTGVIYRLAQKETSLVKAIGYVWNPSADTAIVNRLQLRVYRP